MTNTLYCFGESGNAYKAALALELAGIDWTPRFVDFFKGEARSPAFGPSTRWARSRCSTRTGTILTQSGVIQDWVMDETGKLCGDGSKATRREILRWTIFDNQKVSGMAGPLRFMMNFLPEDKRSTRGQRLSRGAAEGGAAGAGRRAGGRDWLVGDA
jgi:glutathione S-transferase